MRFPRRLQSAFTLCLLLCVAPALHCAEIYVMTSGTFTAAYLELKPKFEAATGHRLVTKATSMGAGETTIPKRLERGERADLVIMDSKAVASGVKDGLIRSDSHVDLVRSRIAMAVRAGAPLPDISTVDAFRRTLLAAKSIGYSASVSGDFLAKDVFPRLGIADEIRARCRRIEVERVGNIVARGDLEIGFQQMSELLPIQGISIVGPLPAEVQYEAIFAAGIPVKSEHAVAAKAFIAFLGSEASREAIKKTGLDPLVGNWSKLDAPVNAAR
jgi:molybdate transport system substrate-binding protein